MNCGLSCLTEDLSLSLLRGAFHGSTVIAHPPVREKRGKHREGVSKGEASDLRGVGQGSAVCDV